MSDKKEKIIVNGFIFENEEEAKQAQKEIEGVKFIKEKVDMNKPEAVLDVYNKMIRQKLFETVIGFSYLKELQDYLYSIPFVDNTQILPIPVEHPTLEEQLRKKRPAQKPKQQQTVKAKERFVNVDYKKRYHAMKWVSIVLAVCVIAMFAISATASHPTILNYEQEIINRYTQWEEELENREAVILEREAALGIENP